MNSANEEQENDMLKQTHPRSLKYQSFYLYEFVKTRLWLQVLVGMVLGLLVGFSIGPTAALIEPQTASVVSNWLVLPGHLFLALVQMIVIPLVFASIVRGIAATEDIDQLKKIGLRVIVYFIVTTAVAIVIGISLAYLIKPGTYIDMEAVQSTLGNVSVVSTATPTVPSLEELPKQLISLLPSNPLTSMVESNMLQVVIFSMIMGMALVIMTPSQAKPLLDLLGSLQEVSMTVVRWAMWLAPLAVFGLMTQLTAKIGLDALFGMAIYVGTVLAGLLILFLLYLLILVLFTKQGPLKFFLEVREVMLLAFSTSSSAAVMALAIKTAQEKLQVRSSISQFVIPLGATINMNGTALYQGVAVIFLAQVFGVDISIGGLLLIILTAVGSSIGSPAAPGVGIVILAMLLETVGIPAAGVALIMGVDRILDMSRTAINVSGDLVAAKLMDSLIGGKKSESDIVIEEISMEKIRKETGQDVITGN